MKRFATLLLLLPLFMINGLPSAVHADEISEKMERAKELKNQFQDEDALKIFESVIEMQQNNYFALFQSVMLHTSIGYRENSSSIAESHFDQAVEYANRLLEHYPDSAASHFAYAASIGRKAQSAGARERVRLSKEIRDHAETAVELDPEYARAWNVLGVWHHRAANLTRVERFAANALFGGAPEGASNENAREAFKMALSLNPDFILYYHDQAEFFITIGEEENARKSLETGLQLETSTSDDEIWKENMRNMLRNL